MTQCTSCGTDNPEGFTFCGSCGTSLAGGGCPACGFVNQQAQRYCGRCGTVLVTPETARVEDADTGERKLATVLFADVVGFTSLAEDGDPESVAHTVDAALRRIAGNVVEHGGTVDKYMGDSLMALFGVPAAHDDDAERAVAAALAIRDAGDDLRFSIGINSGEVMVTAIGDDGDVTVIGDAVNVAARLEKAAGAGEILVGPLTAELVADRFELQERDPAILKGKRQPVATFEVLGRPGALPGPLSGRPTLVGREAELDFLRAAWQRAIANARATVLLVSGEAGVGKSRLADEVCARVEADGTVVRAACPGYGALVGSRLAVELTRQLGAGAPVVGEGSAAAKPAALDEQGVWRLRRLIADRAAEKPLLLVIDDCHNATAADLDPLVQLTARLADMPVVVLLLGRPQPGTWIAKFAGATTLRIDPLSTEDAAKLAKLLTAEGELTSDAARAIAAQAGGNPLYVRELVRLVGSGGRDGRVDEPRRPLPATLQAVLAGRLDMLPARDKAVLQDVAIFTDGASAREIAAVAGGDVDASLDRLVTAGLLAEREGRHLVGDPLLREVAYEQLPHTTRGERHRQAAAVAATSLGRARHLGLAASYVPADTALRDAAAAELGQAGLELLAGSHVRDGLELLRRAFQLGFAEPAGLLRLAEVEIDIGQSASALEVLDRIDAANDPNVQVAVLHARGNAVRAEDLGRSAEMLAETAGRWAKLGNDRKRAWALANRGMTLFEMGLTEEAAASDDEAMQIFTRLGDREGMAAAGQALALERPDDPRVPAWLDAGLELAEETGDLAQQRNSLITLAWTRFIRANLGGAEVTAQSLGHAAHLAEVCSELGDRYFEAQAHCMAAAIRRMSGELDEAAECLARAQRLVPNADRRDPLLPAVEYMVAMSRDGTAAPPERATATGPLAILADALVIEAQLLAGDVEAATAHLAGSKLDVAPGRTQFLTRLIGATRGAVLVLSGRYTEAEESLIAARDSARSVGAWPTEVTATALLAEVEICRGNVQAARDLLAEVADDPGGIAGLTVERARWLLGDEQAGERLRAGSIALAAPGLAMPPKGG